MSQREGEGVTDRERMSHRERENVTDTQAEREDVTDTQRDTDTERESLSCMNEVAHRRGGHIVVTAANACFQKVWNV